jgi:large subunit ribosomal protein L41
MHPTAPLFRSIRRLALNTKQAGKDYYKGNRTGSMGSHTKYGGYIVDPKKVRHYVCPDLSDFNVSGIEKKRSLLDEGTNQRLTLDFLLLVDAFRREAH